MEDHRTFDDKSIWQGRNITALRLLCGSYFESVQIRYGSQWGPVHGYNTSLCPNSGGTTVEYDLAETEYIHTIGARYGAWIDSINFTTNTRMLPRCGGDCGSNGKTVSGSRLMYISRAAECYVGGVQPHWEFV